MHGRINHAYRRLQEYLKSKHTWGARHASVLGARPVAYFSAEFGLHESMPIYSGGLGILAGDHLRARRIWAFRSWVSGCSTTRATSGSGSMPDLWQHEEYVDTDHRCCPWSRRWRAARQ